MAPNLWDIVVLTLILGLMAALAWGTSRMAVPYQIGTPIPISLEPSNLPGYAISTVVRMFIALLFSLLFSFSIAPLAAKNRHAERVIIPLIDIMQSIPVLGILSITVVGFIHLFPNSMLGPECAAIFAIFTGQVWNMALSLYQSLRTVPHDLNEAATMFQLSRWQRFWRVEVPHATPPLLWNTMVSMSAGWFFVVYSEAIEVSNQSISLPGIGSYINLAIVQSDMTAMGYAIVTMFIVILLYDQLLFRPLLAWAEKFRAELDEDTVIHESWFFDILAKTRLLRRLEGLISTCMTFCLETTQRWVAPVRPAPWPSQIRNRISRTSIWLWNLSLIGAIVAATWMLGTLIHQSVSMHEVMYVFGLGGITAAKVFILIAVASLIWIPIGIWIGLRPRLSLVIQPFIQFLAAFPANFFYPLVVILILRYDLNRQIWTTPLMILGTQWYILFNVISGASNIPKELRLAAKNFGVTGNLWWRKLALPAIFPYYATGAMTAAGGCWNASIVAEYVQWGDATIVSLGLGHYIQQYTQVGDFPRIALGIAVMCFYVMLFNRLIWHKCYQLAHTRFTLEV